MQILEKILVGTQRSPNLLILIVLLQIWDFSSQLNALAESEKDISNGDSNVSNQAPLIKFGHKDEGFAIDWSPLVPGRLISGNECIIHSPFFLACNKK